MMNVMEDEQYDTYPIVYVRNLPFKIKPVDLYELFGKFGSIRQIRRGNGAGTRGTAFVVYEDIRDAKLAIQQLSGFHVGGRYLVCLLFQSRKQADI